MLEKKNSQIYIRFLIESIYNSKSIQQCVNMNAANLKYASSTQSENWVRTIIVCLITLRQKFND